MIPDDVVNLSLINVAGYAEENNLFYCLFCGRNG